MLHELPNILLPQCRQVMFDDMMRKNRSKW